MPPRNEQLPEGTDHIINGAMETNGGGGGGGSGGGGASTGTGGTAPAGAAAGTEPGGPFIGAAASGGDTGGAAAGGGAIADQLRSQVGQLRDQAGERVRDFAEGGKTRASDLLVDLSRIVGDTADSIDQRLGNDYGEYARKAADAVSGLADSLRRQEVDELYDSVRSAVRKSPAVAIGVAAVLGFTLVRLVKAGLPESGPSGRGNDGPGA